jgi:hypothetical protein
MRQIGVLPHPKIVKQRLNVKYDLSNNPLVPELVYGIHVLNVGNHIEFLLAYF